MTKSRSWFVIFQIIGLIFMLQATISSIPNKQCLTLHHFRWNLDELLHIGYGRIGNVVDSGNNSEIFGLPKKNSKKTYPSNMSLGNWVLTTRASLSIWRHSDCVMKYSSLTGIWIFPQNEMKKKPYHRQKPRAKDDSNYGTERTDEAYAYFHSYGLEAENPNLRI